MSILKLVTITLAVGLITACGNNFVEKKTDTFKPEYTFQDPKVAELAQALKVADLKKVEQSINSGVDLNTIGTDNLNLLYWLAVKVKDGPERRRSFEYLLQKGADPLIFHATTGETLFHKSVDHADSFFLEKIIEYNPEIDLDIEVKNNPSWPTALYQAMLASRGKNLEVLIDRGADIEYIDGSGDKPIDSANWYETLILLEAGADYRGGPINYIGESVDDFPDLVWKIENMPLNGQKRDKIIQFLINKGVELYPWYPEDDPRYNPRPEEKKINPYKNYYKQYYSINKGLVCSREDRRDIYNDLTEKDFNSWVPFQGAALTVEPCSNNANKIIMSGIDTEITYQIYDLQDYHMVEVKLEIYDKLRTNQDAKIKRTRQAVILYNKNHETMHIFQDSLNNDKYLIPVERFLQY